jgi:hypothetical protein
VRETVRLPRRFPSAQSTLIVLVAALIIGFLAWPMLFTSSGFAQDWSNHLWYLWRQGVTIGRDHEPTLFLNDGGSVFYPFYAFYGGTIYAIGGALDVLFGNAPVAAYIVSYLLGFAAAYGGWYALARMAGLGRWQAQIPGLLYVTSAYYLTLVYARGDWPEFIAVSMIPLLVGAGLRVLLADELSLRWAVLLAVSAIVFFGSHNITMLWGVTAFVITGLLVAVAVPGIRRRVTRKGLIRLTGVLVPAALVNAWYLLPAVAYGQRSFIAKHYDYEKSMRTLSFLVSDRHLFTFSRASAVKNTPDFVLALPVLTVVWVIAGLLISLAVRGNTGWRRALWVFCAVSVIFGVLMTHVGLLLDLPRPYTLLQFSYRLETYVLLGLIGAVLAILVLSRTWPQRWRRWSWTVVVVVIASAAGAVEQIDSYPRGNKNPGVVVPDRYAVFDPHHQPPFTGGLGDYNDATLPLVEPAGTPVGVRFPTAIRHQQVTVTTNLRAGAMVHTNLTGAPDLVKVTGARVVGQDQSGDMVLAIDQAGATTGRITLSRSSRLPVVAGYWLTRFALLVLLLLLVAAPIRRMHARRGHRV